MRALVTGGGGFLGRAIVQRLLGAGHQVTVLGRSEYPAVVALGAKTLRGDIADPAAVNPAIAGQDVVFHVAARAGVWGPREAFHATNVVGTRNVIAACREHGVKRLVFTSSPSVVFDGRDHLNAGPELPYPDRYLAHYPETKAAAEREVLAANGPMLSTVALRPHLIYGPGDPHLVPRLVQRARAGRLRVVGDGRNKVGITFVDNAADAHVAAAERLTPGAVCAGRAYFVTDATPVELWTWINDLLGRLGVPRATSHVPAQAARFAGALLEGLWTALPLRGEPPMTRFVAAQLATSHTYDLAPAKQDLGWEPRVGPEEALEHTVAWWKQAAP